jgi:hypothetical protein
MSAHHLIQKYLFLALCFGDRRVYSALQRHYEEEDSYDASVIRDIINIIYDYRDTTPYIMQKCVMSIPDAPRVLDDIEHTMDEWIHEHDCP